jgi:hypothetical protein
MGLLWHKLRSERCNFSFHFDDIMRVNNVRQAWRIDHPDAPKMRSFYDSSLMAKPPDGFLAGARGRGPGVGEVRRGRRKYFGCVKLLFVTF